MTAYFFERTLFADLCEECGDWAPLVAVCEFPSGRRLKELCEPCFTRWQMEQEDTG